MIRRAAACAWYITGRPYIPVGGAILLIVLMLTGVLR